MPLQCVCRIGPSTDRTQRRRSRAFGVEVESRQRSVVTAFNDNFLSRCHLTQAYIHVLVPGQLAEGDRSCIGLRTSCAYRSCLDLGHTLPRQSVASCGGGRVFNRHTLWLILHREKLWQPHLNHQPNNCSDFPGHPHFVAWQPVALNQMEMPSARMSGRGSDICAAPVSASRPTPRVPHPT
jgi:hypothetical protein